MRMHCRPMHTPSASVTHIADRCPARLWSSTTMEPFPSLHAHLLLQVTADVPCAGVRLQNRCIPHLQRLPHTPPGAGLVSSRCFISVFGLPQCPTCCRARAKVF